MTSLHVGSGSYRFKYFSSACILPCPFSSGISQNEDTAASLHVKRYKENCAQTESCSHVRSDANKKNKPTPRVEKLRFESRGREMGKKSEIAMPPMTDAKSIEEYKRLLEENENKALFLREQEMDEMIEEKLLEIKKDLERRYPRKPKVINEVVFDGNQTSLQDKIMKMEIGPPKTTQTFRVHTNKHVESGRMESKRRPKTLNRIESSGRKIQEQKRCLQLVESCF